MTDISTLYDEVILDHIKNARNYRVLERADRTAEGVNPLCGDSFTVYVRLQADRIEEASFQCSCCGISMASASVMTQAVRGKTVEQAQGLYRRFLQMLSQPTQLDEREDVAELAVLAVVRDFPSRRNCAALAWHTFAAALEGRSHTTIGG